MRLTRTRATVAALAAALAFGTASSPTYAGPGDAPGALLDTLDDMASGLGGVDLSTNPNIACKVEAYGTYLTQHVPFIVGEIYGSDQGYGRLTCISFDTLAYTATVTIRLQYWVAGAYNNIGTCPAVSQTRNTTNGILVIPLVQTNVCTYATGSVYLNTWHRAFASATTNFAAAGPNPTTPSPSSWFMHP